MPNFRNRLLKFLSAENNTRKQSHGWTEWNRMKKTGKFVLLFALLLASTLAEDDPEPIFKALGEVLEMSYCFGDYIAVYRITAEGRQLLGQSSSSVSPPDDFKGRINIINLSEGLLSLRILNLRFNDSGFYTSVCKSDSNKEIYHKFYLYVCGEEISSQEILLTPGTGADLVCNISLIKQVTTTVKWFRDIHNTSLFLDTKTSLEPLQKEFKGLVQVRDKGSLHVLDDFIRDRPRFVCLVIEGEQCRSFQSIMLPDEPEMKYIYRSVGENIALSCSVDHLRQNFWETPLGQVNSSAPVHFKGTTWIQFVSKTMTTANYSLVIDSLTTDHSGTYKCISTFLVEVYFVNVCPLLESASVPFSTKDENVVLKCSFMNSPAFSGKVDFPIILWFRNLGEGDNLIMESGDPSLLMPDDLKDRAYFTEVDFSLVITDPKEEDNGTYWCVVLQEEVDDADPNNAPSSGDNVKKWLMDEEDIDMCLFRQVTNLKFQLTPNGKILPISPPDNTSKPEPKSEPGTNLTMYAVCGVLILLFVLSLIGVVVGIKMKAKRRPASSQRGGAEPSEEEGCPLRSNATKT